MTKLTNADRVRICETLSNIAFGKRVAAIEERRPAVVAALVKAMHGKHWDAMHALPEEAFPAFTALILRRANNGDRYCLSYPRSLPRLPIFHRFNHTQPREEDLRDIADYDATPLFAFIDDDVALEKERREFEFATRELLGSVPTYKRLHKVWPELKGVELPTADTATGCADSAALAATVKRLNSALGIAND